jgi:HEAT repeat protein
MRLSLIGSALVSMLQIASLGTVAQDVQITSSFPPRTFAQVLKEHGITDLSESTLIAALSSTDSTVRNVAANKLAEDGRSDSIPAIEVALMREKDLDTRAGIAVALWSLHDPQGLEQLHLLCTDANVGVKDLLPALRALQLTHSSSGVCAETLLGAMAREREGGYLSMAISTLPGMYSDVSSELATRIFDRLRDLLLDRTQEASVRMMSSRVLAQIGRPESVEVIRSAISQETDPNVRAFYETSLSTITNKP